MKNSRENDLKKTQKGRGGTIAFFILMPIMMLFVMGMPFLLQKFQKTPKEPVYSTVSLREEATARAYVWLNRIEDMPFSYEEVRERMGDIPLTIVENPAEEKGRYVRTLAEGSYEECLARARSGLEQIYRDVVRYRFAAAGYEGEVTDEMLDERMREAYGVSVSEYLEACEIQLLPTLEEATQMYAGEVSYE